MRYIFAAIGVVVLIILIIILFMRIGSTNTPRSGRAPLSLTDYINKDSEVRLTTYGPVVGNEQRQSVRLSVSPANRFFTILQTYESAPVNPQTYGNNHNAYEIFMHSLSGLGFADERTVKDQDRLGACPFGQVSVYQLFDQGKEVLNTWSDTCRTKDGTFAGSASSVARLFQAQFADYNTLTQNLSF